MFANVIQINPPFTAAFCQHRHSFLSSPPRHSFLRSCVKMGSSENKFKTLSTVEEEEEEDGSTINNNFYDVYGPQVYFLFYFVVFNCICL